MDRKRFLEEHARPLVKGFFDLLRDFSRDAVPQSALGQAVSYALKLEVALSRFLEDGRLPIHNNLSELALRREAVGRKNWLFVGSDDAGAVNALFTSLLVS